MKWGIRRFQNPDGTLTPEGKKRYRESLDKALKYNESLLQKYLKFDKEDSKLQTAARMHYIRKMDDNESKIIRTFNEHSRLVKDLDKHNTSSKKEYQK